MDPSGADAERGRPPEAGPLGGSPGWVSGDIGARFSPQHKGTALLHEGYGYADVDRRTPVDPARTLFRIGSVSKLFTWTAVMQLVELGKLDLDADVNQYLDFTTPATYPQPITLKHILTHTAGSRKTSGTSSQTRRTAFPWAGASRVTSPVGYDRPGP